MQHPGWRVGLALSSVVFLGVALGQGPADTATPATRPAVTAPHTRPAATIPHSPATTAADAAATQTEEEAFETFPAGIVDLAWNNAYIVSPGGALEAIELKSGKKLWTSENIAIPVAISGDRVYALTHTASGSDDHPALVLLGLSIKGEGKIVFTSKAIPVDEWVTGELAGKNFLATARMENGKMTLSWSFSTTPAGKNGDRRPRGGQEAHGNAKITLENGAVEILKSDPPLVHVTRVSTAAFAGQEYTITEDDNGRMLLVCAEHKSRRDIWSYSVEPGAVGAAVIKPVPVKPSTQGGVPMPFLD